MIRARRFLVNAKYRRLVEEDCHVEVGEGEVHQDQDEAQHNVLQSPLDHHIADHNPLRG